MKILFFALTLLISSSSSSLLGVVVQKQQQHNPRRILHQPLFPATSSPPSIPPPPPPENPVFPNPDQPFFHEVPTGDTPDQNQVSSSSPPAATAINGSIPIAAAPQQTKPTKTVAIAISVGIVTLGMLSALAFFLYRHKAKHPLETQKLVGDNNGDNRRNTDESSRAPPSSFLYIGTVEPSIMTSSSFTEANGTTTKSGGNRSPYHKLNSVKRSDRYRPSPELQPLPPLPKQPPPQDDDNNNNNNAISMSSSSEEEESRGTAFYTPQRSSVSNGDSYFTPATIPRYNSGAHSKRTSPKSRLSSVSSSPDRNHVIIIPSIKQSVAQQPTVASTESQSSQGKPVLYTSMKPKFAAPPPPPNMSALRTLNDNQSEKKTKVHALPPAPPPPPPPLPASTAAMSIPRKVGETSVSSMSKQVLTQTSWTARAKPKTDSTDHVEEIDKSALENIDVDDTDETKPKLKPLHWDKVRATSDRATVWDQLKSSSFQLNEDRMETLFGHSSTNSIPKEPTRKPVFPPFERENRVLDPKKSQNIAILLRALNVTQDEVSEALLDGSPESLGAELLETLVKMAPTKEEEIKLREYTGDISKLGSAERFLRAVLDVPFAFKRVEAMLYIANFDAEVKYLRKSFETLEAASEELKNSRLFLKLLEAVLRTGNRMNVGTNRGDAKSFKLDTLLKLVDIKGTDGKTTLLHFVVQEVIRSEGSSTNSANEKLQKNSDNKMNDDDFRRQGLQVVAGLSQELSNAKKSAGMDSDVLSSYLSKLEMGLEKVRLVFQHQKPEVQGKFFTSMTVFLKEAEEEISKIKVTERKTLSHVKEVTEYFHGDVVKEEAHPFRIFVIVRDFLNILDNVCKEVRSLHDKTLVGSARSFRISATAPLPVLNRYRIREDISSDEEISSP